MSGNKRPSDDPAGSLAKRLKSTVDTTDQPNGHRDRTISGARDEPTRLRESVGPAFEAAPTVTENFKRAIVDDSEYSNFVQFLGISGGNNHCYRNAILTAFLSPATVMRYLIRWHYHASDDESRHPEDSIVTRLARLSSSLFGLNKVRAFFSRKQTQITIDLRVLLFWRKFCYEASPSSSLYSPESWRHHIDDVERSQENGQHDANEFLTWLMTTMQGRIQLADIHASSNAPTDRFGWVFRSLTVDRVTCESCRYPVRRRIAGVVPEFCLNLQIPSASGCPGVGLQLIDLLDNFMHSEIPGKDCPRCGKTSACTQHKKFQHAPALLTMAISRATRISRKKTSPRSGKERIVVRLGKNMSVVTIPDQLDISQHLNMHEFGKGSRVTYSLSSVVSHRGTTLHAGHYVSYIRGGTSRNEWAEIDDSTVTPKVLSDFDDSGAMLLDRDNFQYRFTPYVVFYERNFAKDKLTPGRAAENVGQGDDKDEQPIHWTKTVSEATPVANDVLQQPPTDAVNDVPAVNNKDVTGPGSNANAGGHADALGSANAEDDVNSTGDAGNVGDTTNGGNAGDRGTNDDAGNTNAVDNASAAGGTSPTVNADTEGNTNGVGDDDAARSANHEGVVSDLPAWTEGAGEDERFPPAVLLVTITIGGVEVQLPRHIISQFRWGKAQDIKIDARLRIPKGECKRVLNNPNPEDYVEAKLSDIQHEAYYFKRREQERAAIRIQKKPKPWNKFWIKVRQGSDDLTLEQTKEILRLTNREEEVTQDAQESADVGTKHLDEQDDAASGRSQ